MLEIDYYAVLRRPQNRSFLETDAWSDIEVELCTGEPSQHRAVPTLPGWILSRSHVESQLQNARSGAGGRGNDNAEFVARKSQKQRVDNNRQQEQQVANEALQMGRSNEYYNMDGSRRMRNEEARTASASAGDPSEEDASAQADEAAPEVLLKAGGANDVFVLPGRHTIPAGGHDVRLPIAKGLSIATLMRRVAVPKLESHTFLLADFVNTLSYKLLPGKAVVFIDGMLLGRTRLPFVGVNGRATVELGVDKEVQVQRRLAANVVSTTGSLSWRRTRRDVTYAYTIRSQRAKPVLVQIRDTVPVSQDPDSLVVSLHDPRPVNDKTSAVIPSGAPVLAGQALRLLPDANVTMNDRAVLEWHRNVTAEAPVSFHLHFAVSWNEEEPFHLEL